MKRDILFGMLPFYLLAVIIFVGIAKVGSNAVTAINQNMPPEREHTVIIDAGHGGIDGGATSCTGVLESAINLEIALRLNDLVRFLGLETVMIRTTDTSIYTEGSTIAAQKVSDLKERVRIVNEVERGVLVSIHQNTFSNSRYGGAQVFYAQTEGSKDLANAIQSAFVQSINPNSKRTSKKASGIYLMDNIKTTGILVECGFLSNPGEEAKLRTKDYQQKLCCVIAASLSEYLSNT